MHTRLFRGALTMLAALLVLTAAHATAAPPPPTQIAPTPPPGGTFIAGSIPSGGGFGLVVFSGGTFEQLVTAAGCRATTAVAYWSTNTRGDFVTFVPSSTVGAVNAGFASQFPTGTVPANTPLIGRCAPTTGQPQVTLADDRGTVTLRVGDTFLLNLGTEWNWNVEIANPAILTRVVNIVAPPAGTQGTYSATAAGTTKLTASGGLNCPPNMACPAIARIFEVTIVIR